MAFKPLTPDEWPTDTLREFVAVIRNPQATPELIADMSECLLGVSDPPMFDTLADILVAAEIFSSKGQANKAGAKDTEIPLGLSVFRIGKLKTAIWIWNPV